MSRIGNVLRLPGALARSPAKVEQTYAVAATANHVVLEIQEQLAAIEEQVRGIGPPYKELADTLKAQAANLETLHTSQLEALTYLNRTLRELSERVGALEKAAGVGH